MTSIARAARRSASSPAAPRPEHVHDDGPVRSRPRASASCRLRLLAGGRTGSLRVRRRRQSDRRVLPRFLDARCQRRHAELCGEALRRRRAPARLPRRRARAASRRRVQEEPRAVTGDHDALIPQALARLCRRGRALAAARGSVSVAPRSLEVDARPGTRPPWRRRYRPGRRLLPHDSAVTRDDAADPAPRVVPARDEDVPVDELGEQRPRVVALGSESPSDDVRPTPARSSSAGCDGDVGDEHRLAPSDSRRSAMCPG